MLPSPISLSPKITFYRFPKLPEMLIFLVTQWDILANNEIQKKGFFSVALSGGKTPRQLYEKMAKIPIPWNSWKVFWSDERVVPPEDPRSNFGMARQTLLAEAPISSYFPIPFEIKNLDCMALDYEQQLLRQLPLHPQTQIPQFDLILLGIGGDGHTASLFPESQALQEKKRWVVPSIGSLPICPRITFTFPLINHAKQIWIVATGPEKKSILTEVFQTYSQKKYPIQSVTPEKGHLFWFVDQDAIPDTILLK